MIRTNIVYKNEDIVLKGSGIWYDQNKQDKVIVSKWFLRVVKFGKRKMKEVDAKHLLFLWDREAAKQCWLELE